MFVVLACTSGAASSADPLPTVTAKPLERLPLTGIPGKEGLMLEVTVPAGASSAPHRHDADVFVYVLEGSVVMQVAGGEPQTLGVGQTFHENPADVHLRSENASKTAPARLLVFFVKNVDVPASRPAGPGGDAKAQ